MAIKAFNLKSSLKNTARTNVTEPLSKTKAGFLNSLTELFPQKPEGPSSKTLYDPHKRWLTGGERTAAGRWPPTSGQRVSPANSVSSGSGPGLTGSIHSENPQPLRVTWDHDPTTLPALRQSSWVLLI